jgi:hypothetical protein
MRSRLRKRPQPPFAGPSASPLLSEREEADFKATQDAVRLLADHSDRKCPEDGTDPFELAIDKLWDFVCEGAVDDRWKRVLFCGLIKCEPGIATNVNRLQEVMEKPKTFINSRLHARYDSERFDHYCPAALAILPESIRNDPNVYRHWSFRCFRKSTQQHKHALGAELNQIIAEAAETFCHCDNEPAVE